jgi:hypothetical protein
MSLANDTVVTPRERVFAALDFRNPGVVPVEYHASPSGFFEHGARLAELWARYPDDFGPPGRFPMARPGPGAVDAEGRYCETLTDAWGVVRRHLVFGSAGNTIHQPLCDWAQLDGYRFPPLPDRGPSFTAAQARAARHRERYFLKTGWISLFELMHALRPFEDVLADIALDSPEIHRLADSLVEYQAGYIDWLLARGVDAIQFGDDFGTQLGLLLSPRSWRAFFRPRYERLIRQAHEGGAKVFFHSCGCIRPLLDDFAALQVDGLWPQLNTYDVPTLARFSRQARVAIAIHPDRGDLMIRDTPAAVRDAVLRLAETFEIDRGGSWFYVEIDAGFPFANVEALTETIASLRGAADMERKNT